MHRQSVDDTLSPFASEAPGLTRGFAEAQEDESRYAPWSQEGDPYQRGEHAGSTHAIEEEEEAYSDLEADYSEVDRSSAGGDEAEEYETSTFENHTGELEPEHGELAAQHDPEFGGAVEGELSESRATVGDSESWAELELPASIFPQEDEEYGEYEEESPAALEPGLSPLALRGRLHPGQGARKAPWLDHVYGLVVHTSGGCLPRRAREARQRPDLYAVQYYVNSGGTHYVNGWAGVDGKQLHQVMNERPQAWGVGRWKSEPATDQWKSTDAGRFELDLAPAVLRLWRARWPGFKDSLSLIPVRSNPNMTYVHVECVPCRYARDLRRNEKGEIECAGPYITAPEAAPMRPGLHFTRAQHETVVRLAWDIAQRHAWPQDRWWLTPRLLGHEDITPLSRSDRDGGWDPGGLREKPYFDWRFVHEGLERLRNGGATPSAMPATAITTLTSSVGSLLGSLAERFRQLVQAGQEVVAITEAVKSGQSDVNQLANLVFFARHPELKGRPIRPDERQLAQEWLDIRDNRVRPLVARLSTARPAPSAPPAPAPRVASTPAPAPAGGQMLFGLDTASIAGNKNPNWAQASAQVPLSFAIIRSNWGVWPDSAFHRDWPKINDAGMVRGAYLFLRFPHSKHGHVAPSPVAQAKALIKTVGNLDESDLPPTVDVEFPGGVVETRMTPAQLLDGVRDAWRVLKAHYGVAPIIYTSARVWGDDLKNLPAPDLVESALWLAQYCIRVNKRLDCIGKGPAVHDRTAFAGGRRDPPVPPPWGDSTNWWFHQYQGDAVKLPGFPTGNVDMNRFNTMTTGATGDRVKWVQRRLGILQSGTFDAAMETTLQAFQNKKGLVANSVIDPRTFAYLCWSNP